MATPQPRSLSRREFARHSAVAAALAVLGTSSLTRAHPEEREAPADPERPRADSPPDVFREARALARVVRIRYGSRLDRAALREITRGIEGGLRGAAALREVPLANGDEPAFVFRAWRADRG
jgi:hypothetical protein